MGRELKAEHKGIWLGTHNHSIKGIIYSIRRLMQADELYTKELSKTYNISSTQLNCLIALFERGPMPISRIAELIMVNSSTVTGTLDRLEKKGLVKRSRISEDRRIITIGLTENGRIMAEHAPPPIQQKIVDGLNRLSEEEIHEIAGMLIRLTSMLDGQDIEATSAV